MGQTAGTTTRYINPYTGKVVSDRYFRQKNCIPKISNELGIEWQKEWTHNTGMNWDKMPSEIEKQLRDYSKYKQTVSEKISMPSKHKYAYVLGKDKRKQNNFVSCMNKEIKFILIQKREGNKKTNTV